MKIRFLGACQEVGRSAFAVRTRDKYLLLDYGVMVNHEIGYPVHIPPRDVEAILLTHAHLDHAGLIPLFYIRGRIPTYGVEPTFGFADILIKDMIKLSGYYLPFEHIDLRTFLEHKVKTQYNEPVSVGGAKVTFVNAGHIPGSSQIIVEHGGKRILYTGDFNLTPTRLVSGADRTYSGLDAIIIESTYAMKDHPDRNQTEENFVNTCREIVEDKGTVLVPAFGVGRSQEVMCMLKARGFSHPVFVDGMALDAIRTLDKHPNSLGDSKLFRHAVEDAHWINSRHERQKAVKTPGVIVSPAGMLKGGAAVFYMDSISRGERNGVFLVSFQVDGSPGRILLDEKRFAVRGKVMKVNARVEQFDFSSHGGRTELQQTLKMLDRDTRVFIVHGEPESCKSLSDYARTELSLEAFAPSPGETYEV
jgi:putative mRNA 3-end processing factor